MIINPLKMTDKPAEETHESLRDKVGDLIDVAKSAGLTEMTWQEGGVKIAFRRNVTAKRVERRSSVQAAAAEPKVMEEIIRSPIVGVFRRSISKDRPPLVLVGNHVKPGDRIGIVECMKIPTDVISLSQGKIVEITVEDGQAVEYGQPLFVIRPEPANA